jgi:hypothetical protein
MYTFVYHGSHGPSPSHRGWRSDRRPQRSDCHQERGHAHTQPATTMVEVVIIVLSAACDDLYARLQYSKDSNYECKAYNEYFEVFHFLLTENGEYSPPTSGDFQSAAT